MQPIQQLNAAVRSPLTELKKGAKAGSECMWRTD